MPDINFETVFSPTILRSDAHQNIGVSLRPEKSLINCWIATYLATPLYLKFQFVCTLRVIGLYKPTDASQPFDNQIVVQFFSSSPSPRAVHRINALRSSLRLDCRVQSTSQAMHQRGRRGHEVTRAYFRMMQLKFVLCCSHCTLSVS